MGRRFRKRCVPELTVVDHENISVLATFYDGSAFLIFATV